MSKTGIIIRREYFIRVKKKSFLVMTFLGPILIASLWIIPFFLALNSDTQSKVLVVDETLIEKNGIKMLIKDFPGMVKSVSRKANKFTIQLTL